MPPEPAAGMPASVALPLPLSIKVTPLGSVLAVLSAGVGLPIVVIMNAPGVPTTKVVPAALVIAGAWFTVSVNVWLASGEIPFAASKATMYVPPDPSAGVPDSIPVPLPLSMNVTPLGNASISLNAGVGVPVVVTVNDPNAPTVNVALLPLVIAGAVPT